jgi:pyruvate dehydrogenase E2 component (dihydrolipoamide acetyltransferase)
MSMQSSITLPQLSASLVDATVVRWLKNPGDGFSEGDVLVELEVENALLQLQAAQAGTLQRIVAQPRQTVQVGGQLAAIVASHAPAAPPASAAKPETAPAATAPKPAAGPPAPSSGGNPQNVTPVLMPQASNTMEEGILVAWKVSEGDQIQVGQVICEIETDKATVEYEAPDGGRLARIIARENDSVPIKEPIAVLADNDADADAYLAARGTPGEAATAAPATVAAGVSAAAAASPVRPVTSPAPLTAEGRVKASPAARKIAAQRGLDLTRLGSGSGPAGRILSVDVQRAELASPATDGQPIRRPMPKMRRAIGLNLQRSKQNIPHFYLRLTIDAAPLVAYYREQKPATGCTINDCIVLATGRAMAEFPAVRSQIVGDEIVEFPHANIGIAVGVEHGLVVPVVCRVDTLTLGQLAAEAKRVVQNARNGKLDNVGQGNFTITNLGMFGIEEFAAIINPPESGILAVSAARESVIVQNGSMRAGQVMTLTLSADHRMVDGLCGAKFLARLKEILENPGQALV